MNVSDAITHPASLPSSTHSALDNIDKLLERMPTTGMVTAAPSRALSPGEIIESSVFTSTMATAPAPCTRSAFSTKEHAAPLLDPRCTSAIFPRRASQFRSGASA